MIMLVAFVFLAAGFYREFRKLVGKVVEIVRFIANISVAFRPVKSII